MSLPKLMTQEEVAEYLSVSLDTLNRWRCNFDGPAWVKVGGRIAYPENAIVDYLNSQLNGTAAQKMRLAITAGNAEARAARKERNAELDALTAADRIPDADKVIDPYACTLGFAGQDSGMVRCDPLTGKPIGAQRTVTDFSGRADVTCAVANAQPGVVPVPKP